MASRVCPNCFKPTRKEVCPDCGIMTVRDQSQSGVFRNLLKRIGLSRPPSEQDLVGKTILGRYRVEELIGHGGMGEVYRATQLSTLQEVALKVIKADLAGDPDSIRRFFREARSAGSINHPNVVRVWEFGQLEDFRLFLAMEFLRGQSLADLLRSQRKKGGFRGLDYAMILEVGTQVASALNAAHNKGVVHRDLKPGNIILLDEGALVKVVDFGISKFVGAEASSITRTDLFIGTPAYASPEQAIGGGELDGRSDLYSLGIVLYEMACGHTPFTGVDNPVAQLAVRVHQDAPPLRDQVAPDRIPDGLCVVVDRLLKRSREERYQTAAEVVQDLAGLAMEAGLQSRTPSRGFLPAVLTPPALAHPRTPPPPVGPSENEVMEPTLPARLPQTGPVSTVQAPASERRGSVPWLALLALAVAAASAGGMFFLLSKQRGETAEPAPTTGVAATTADARPIEPKGPEKPSEPASPVHATAPPPPPECRLSVGSKPEGAAIYVGEFPIEGKKTPTTLTFPCDRLPATIRLVLPGYEPETVTLSDLGFPTIQAAAVVPSLKRVQAPTRKTVGCRTDADCRRGQYCSNGRCKDLL